MGIFSEINDWIIRVLDGGPYKEKELETDITKYADIPRLDGGSLHTLFPAKGKRRQILVCVTHDSFENLDYEAQEERLAKTDNEKYRKEAWSDSLSFSSMSSKYKKRGFLLCGAERIEFGLIELTDCIHEGDRGDSDGYGVEPDTWIKAYANLNGKIISPFALSDTELNINVENWLTLKINPIGENGKIKICPYDKVKKAYDLEGYFIVEKNENKGLINKKMNLIIPLNYKMIHGDENGLVWVRMHNDLCGIVDLKNNILIPPVYNYLSYIDKGKHKGLYVAELNGMHGLINQDNQIVMPFQKMDIKSFYELINC